VTETILYSFQGGNDGIEPMGGLVVDDVFNVYGATLGGGGSANCPNGACGTVFQLIPPSSQGGAWTENVLYAFQGETDGRYPDGSPLLSDGWLLGMTSQGGGSRNCSTNTARGCGTVFAVRK